MSGKFKKCIIPKPKKAKKPSPTSPPKKYKESSSEHNGQANKPKLINLLISTFFFLAVALILFLNGNIDKTQFILLECGILVSAFIIKLITNNKIKNDKDSNYNQKTTKESNSCQEKTIFPSSSPKPRTNKSFISPDLQQKDFKQQNRMDVLYSSIKSNSSPIMDIFQGILYSSIKCPNCGHIEEIKDPFIFLSLPIKSSYFTVTLEDCLDDFSKSGF